LTSTTYTVTVGAVTGLSGNALATPVTATFSTGTSVDAIAPTITTVSPANNATAVPRNSQVQLGFSERINPLTVNATTFYVWVLSAGQGAVRAAGTIGVSADGLTATFTPTTPLLPTTAYAVFESGITDLAGNAVAASGQITIFTTGL
jgi:hypothetical protein